MAPRQNYVSADLHHFVGRAKKTDDERYRLLVKIVRSGGILSGAMATTGDLGTRWDRDGTLLDEDLISSDVVCFCDIPLDDLDVHTSKYSRFGLSFSKEFLLSQGVRPVYYVPVHQPSNFVLARVGDRGTIEPFSATKARHALMEIEKAYKLYVEAGVQSHRVRTLGFKLKKALGDIGSDKLGALEKYVREVDKLRNFIRLASSMVYEVGPFIKPFRADLPDDDIRNVYLEREWRAHGGVLFPFAELRRVFVPEQYGSVFRADFPNYGGEIRIL